jgi:Uma2 family endonuclease
VSFVDTNRLEEMIRDPKGFLHGAPDLAIEILSPSNTIQAMKKKADEYFENDTRLVWVVAPEDRTVVVLRPDGSERVLTVTDSLDGEDVIPGFSLVVGELFS